MYCTKHYQNKQKHNSATILTVGITVLCASGDMLFKQSQQAVVAVFADACRPQVTDSQHIEHAEQHNEGKTDAERMVIAGGQPSVVEQQRQETVDDNKDKMLCGAFDDGMCTMRAAIVEPHRRRHCQRLALRYAGSHTSLTH